MSFRSLFSMFATFICTAALIVGLVASPSFAATSSPTKGTDQLPQTEDASVDVMKKPAPMGINEVEARNENGLNEIQGAADKDKMYKADTSKPGPAFAKKIDKALDKITN